MRFRSSAGSLLNPVLASGMLAIGLLIGLGALINSLYPFVGVVTFAAVGTCVVARSAARPRRDAISMWTLKGPL